MAVNFNALLQNNKLSERRNDCQPFCYFNFLDLFQHGAGDKTFFPFSLFLEFIVKARWYSAWMNFKRVCKLFKNVSSTLAALTIKEMLRKFGLVSLLCFHVSSSSVQAFMNVQALLRGCMVLILWRCVVMLSVSCLWITQVKTFHLQGVLNICDISPKIGFDDYRGYRKVHSWSILRKKSRFCHQFRLIAAL